MLVTPLDHLILHVDEYFTLTLINFDVSEMIRLTAADVHPPLYYLILKFAMTAFGYFGVSSHSIYAVRVVSIIPYARPIIPAPNIYSFSLLNFPIFSCPHFLAGFCYLPFYSLELLFVFILQLIFYFVNSFFEKMFGFYSVKNVHELSLVTYTFLYFILLLVF